MCQYVRLEYHLFKIDDLQSHLFRQRLGQLVVGDQIHVDRNLSNQLIGPIMLLHQ